MSDGFVFRMPEVYYMEIAVRVERHTRSVSGLNVLTDPTLLQTLSDAGKEVLAECCVDVLRELNDPLRGISAVDLPKPDSFSAKQNFVYAAATFVALFSVLDEIDYHPDSGMPFMVHKATHSSAQRIKTKNAQAITPDVKLGFHNDFCISKKGVFLPSFIGLYNEFIGYEKRGNFSWVPSLKWDGAIEFQHLDALSEPINMSLSPAIYQQHNEYLKIGLTDLEIPLMSRYSDGSKRYFLNGTVANPRVAKVQEELLTRMKESIARNNFRISVAQKERRIIFVRNDHGFHARDIFESPLPGLDLSRVFLRAVGKAGVSYPSW